MVFKCFTALSYQLQNREIQIKTGLFIAEHECVVGRKLLGNRLRLCIPTTGQWSGSATCQPCELMVLHYELFNNLQLSTTMEMFITKWREAHLKDIKHQAVIVVYVDQGVKNDNGFNVTDYIPSIINITLHHLI